MIPPKSHPRWPKLLSGQLNVQFNVFAGNMLLSRCQRRLARDTSPAAMNECLEEAHAFFTKYEALYGAELKAIF